MRYWKDWLKGEKEMSLCSLGLSCEPPPCEHGKYLNQEQCHLCELQKQITVLVDRYKELSVQVAAQHEFKLRQIDENKNVSKRLYELEHKLMDRIGVLSASLHTLHQENYQLKKKPHKCPVCDGYGGTKISGTIDEKCEACDGKGIIWG